MAESLLFPDKPFNADNPYVRSLGDCASSVPTTAPPSTASLAYAPDIYQLIGVTTWTQQHTFSYKPAVRVLDTNNTEVLIAHNYPDATHVSIVFPSPFTGIVLLS